MIGNSCLGSSYKLTRPGPFLHVYIGSRSYLLLLASIRRGRSRIRHKCLRSDVPSQTSDIGHHVSCTIRPGWFKVRKWGQITDYNDLYQTSEMGRPISDIYVWFYFCPFVHLCLILLLSLCTSKLHIIGYNYTWPSGSRKTGQWKFTFLLLMEEAVSIHKIKRQVLTCPSHLTVK